MQFCFMHERGTIFLEQEFESYPWEVMVCGGITKDGMSKCKCDPCWVYSLRVKANSVLCLQCGK